MKSGDPTENDGGRRRPSRWVAGLLSIVPGAGHMYLGQIGKGFSLMGLLIVTIFVIVLYSTSTGQYWITAYLVPTLSVLFLSYAVFDALAIADARRAGRDRVGEVDPTMQAVWERVLLNRRTIGWVIAVGGAVGLLGIASRPLDALVRERLDIDLPLMSLVMPAMMLAIGVSLLRKGRRRPDS
jgi:TM2 domain-containing membrane protein YozV